jgi:hypothetical protein
VQLQKRGEEAAQLEMAQSAAAVAVAEAAVDAVKQEATQQGTPTAAPAVAAPAAATNSSSGTATGTAAATGSGSSASSSSSGPKELQRCALHLSLGDTLAEMLAQRQRYVVLHSIYTIYIYVYIYYASILIQLCIHALCKRASCEQPVKTVREHYIAAV